MPYSGIENLKWVVWSAVAVTLIALYPQLLMWGVRGSEWNGSYAQIHGDEWLYSAYVQALIDGRPRRSDPYTGRDEVPGQPQPESVFSIQFVPAYLIAIPARLLGISSSTAFIVLGILTPFLSCLAIFWLIKSVTKDHRLAAAGSLVVLCFGGLAAGQGATHFLYSGFQYVYLPFLRRYEPAVMFPLFFVFCGFVWKSLTTDRRAFGWALAAGVALDILIFSYLYLWTTAVAWLTCLAVIWFVARPESLRKDAKSFVTILALGLAALIPYLILLSHRSTTMDAGQKLTLSHAPDLLRIPELLGLAVIALIFFGAVRGKLNWRASQAIFAVSFALTPLVVFNQQVITGHSLQPYHYAWFIANYVALLGGILSVAVIWLGPESAKQPIRNRAFTWLAIIAIWWAAVEVLVPTKIITRESQFIDRAAGVCRRLRQLSNEGMVASTSRQNPRPLVLATDYEVAVILPTFASQSVLWAPNFDFLNIGRDEGRERFYKYLYYRGIDGNKFAEALAQPMGTLAAAAFGHERVLPDLAVQTRPITTEEIAAQAAEYQSYYLTFTHEKAAQHLLSYVIVPANVRTDLSNLDHWYQRDAGENVGDYILYQVRLRL